MWRQQLKTCLQLLKLAVLICAVRHARDMGVLRVTQVRLAVGYGQPHNLSLRAEVFFQSTEDSAPLVTPFLNVSGRWPWTFLCQQLSGDLCSSKNYPTKRPGGLHRCVLWMLFQLSFHATGTPAGCNGAGTVWLVQSCSDSLMCCCCPARTQQQWQLLAVFFMCGQLNQKQVGFPKERVGEVAKDKGDNEPWVFSKQP